MGNLGIGMTDCQCPWGVGNQIIHGERKTMLYTQDDLFSTMSAWIGYAICGDGGFVDALD